MSYLLSDDNKKIVEITNDRGACGKVTNVYDKIKLDDNSFVALVETTDGPIWGVFIIDGKIHECGGTGYATVGELLKEKILTGTF